MPGIPNIKKGIGLVGISSPSSLKQYPTGSSVIGPGTDGYVLQSDSTSPTGFSWVSASGGGGGGGSPTGPAGGDLTGSYPDPTLKTITTAGTSGSANTIPVVTIDAKGRVTTLSSSAVSITTASVSGLGTAAGLTSDTDGTLAANSDTRIATQKATKTYADTKVAKAGDTMTGNLILGSGASLKVSGGISSGQGNIQLCASASAVYDTNLLYLDGNDKTMGMVIGSNPAFVGSSGPFFGGRGNTYSMYANQRGNLFFYAGSPTSPGATEGSLWFGTADTVRLFINKDGKFTLNNGTTSGTGLLNIAGSSTAFSAGDPSVIKVTTNLTPLTNGDAYHTLFSPTITKQSSGTHTNVFVVAVSPPTIAGGAATITNAATFYISGAPSAGTSTNYALWSGGGSNRMDGNLSLGAVATPTAKLHIAGGSATAGTAPLKFTSGSLLATPESGSVEFNGDKLYLTITSSSARKEIVLADNGLTLGRIPFVTSSGRLADSTSLTYVGTALTMSFNQNARTAMVVSNTNAGSSAESGFTATTNAGSTFFGVGSNANTKVAGAMMYTDAAMPLTFWTNNTRRITIRGTDGEVGIGVPTATAVLHLKAGTATAGTAPLKFNSGTLMGTAEAGAIEFLTDKYYATITTGPARKEFTLNDGAITSSVVPYTTTNGRLTGSSNLMFDGTRLFQNGTYTLVPSSSAAAAIIVSGSNTVGGSSYVDFIKVTNTSAGALTPNKTFRLDNSGSIQVINSAYTQNILSLENNGHMNIYGGASATAVSESATSGSLRFGSNNTGYSEIYHDGNFHIHSKALAPMWINTNFSTLNLLTQAPGAGTSKGTGVVMGGDGSQIGFLTVSGSTSYTTAASYGYLVNNSMTPSGYYAGGSQTINVSIYAKDRILGQEIDALSDERMKDIQGEIPAEDAVKLVNNIKPIKYTWKDSEDKGLKTGFSAQQVIKSGFGHLVSAIPKQGMEEIVEEDGFVNPKDTQFVMNYDQVVPYHNSVIKLLLKKIEKLEQTVAELQALRKDA